MKQIFLFSLLALALSFSACKKEDVKTVCDVEDPTKDIQWIKDRIAGSLGDPSITLVEEYEWDGETYFRINDCEGCPDSMSEIRSCDGTLRCRIGGIAGFLCPDFDDAVLVKTWH